MPPTTVACLAGAAGLAIAGLVAYTQRRKLKWPTGATLLYVLVFCAGAWAMALLLTFAHAEPRPAEVLAAINYEENRNPANLKEAPCPEFDLPGSKGSCGPCWWTAKAKAARIKAKGLGEVRAVIVRTPHASRTHTVLRVTWPGFVRYYDNGYLEPNPCDWALLAHDGAKVVWEIAL